MELISLSLDDKFMIRKADFLVKPSGERRFIENGREVQTWHENRIAMHIIRSAFRQPISAGSGY